MVIHLPVVHFILLFDTFTFIRVYMSALNRRPIFSDAPGQHYKYFTEPNREISLFHVVFMVMGVDALQNYYSAYKTIPERPTNT